MPGRISFAVAQANPLPFVTTIFSTPCTIVQWILTYQIIDRTTSTKFSALRYRLQVRLSKIGV